MSKKLRIIGCCVIAAFAFACGSTPEPSGTTHATSESLADRLHEATSNYRSYVKVNRAPFPSGAAAAAINVWASPEAAQPYQDVDPSQPSSRASLQSGAAIVREVFDDVGNVQNLTVIVQGARGYDTDVCDLFFAVTSPAGEPLVQAGVMQQGRLATCAGCHAPRATSGCLLGVPMSAR
jgi:hypothetical protein